MVFNILRLLSEQLVRVVKLIVVLLFDDFGLNQIIFESATCKTTVR